MSAILNLQTLEVSELDYSVAISSGSCDSSSCNKQSN
jgi:hypothetical protein